MSGELTEELIKSSTGEFDVEIVQSMSICNQSLFMGFETLNKCTHVQEIILSKNRFENVDGISKLEFLQVLDLSENHISDLSGFLSTEMPALEVLYLHGNNIREVDQIKCLQKLPRLRTLTFQRKSKKNPCCSHPSYHNLVLQLLPNLKTLDGEHLQLKQSSQQALLDLLDTPEEDLQIPESKPWITSEFQWNDENTFMFDDSFVDKIFDKKMSALGFQASLEECASMAACGDELVRKVTSGTSEKPASRKSRKKSRR